MAESAVCAIAIAGKCKTTPAKGIFAKKAGPKWAVKALCCGAYACKDACGLVDKEREKELKHQRAQRRKEAGAMQRQGGGAAAPTSTPRQESGAEHGAVRVGAVSGGMVSDDAVGSSGSVGSDAASSGAADRRAYGVGAVGSGAVGSGVVGSGLSRLRKIMGVQFDDSEAESMSLLVSGTFIETSTGVEVLDTRWISDYALSDVYAHSLMEVSSRLMLFFARVTHRVGTRALPAQSLSQPQQQPPSQPQPQLQPQPAVPQIASPPGSVRQLRKQIRGLKAAQAIPGQEPAALAARAQEIDGLECDMEERERKFRKYGQW